MTGSELRTHLGKFIQTARNGSDERIVQTIFVTAEAFDEIRDSIPTDERFVDDALINLGYETISVQGIGICRWPQLGPRKAPTA